MSLNETREEFEARVWGGNGALRAAYIAACVKYHALPKDALPVVGEMRDALIDSGWTGCRFTAFVEAVKQASAG